MTRRKDGLWQEEITVTIKGRKVRKFFYGRTKAEVNQKIRQFKEVSEKGELFETVANAWWEEHEPTLEYNTTKQYRPALGRAKKRFDKDYIQQILPSDINQFLRQFIKEKHAAQKTAATQLMILNLIFRYAVANGYTQMNPARDISLPRNLSKAKRSMPSTEDINHVKNSTGCTFGMFAYWILYTGCRRGELLALTWEDVDVENREIHITKSLYHDNNQPKVKTPKTASGNRTVPMMDKLSEKITPGKGIIFKDADGGYITEMHFQKLWAAYRAESGVSCTPHQLRHAYATMLFENGIDVKDAQMLLGHAQMSTTMDIYTHIRDEQAQRIKEKLLKVDI